MMFHFVNVPINTTFDRNILAHAMFCLTVIVEIGSNIN